MQLAHGSVAVLLAFALAGPGSASAQAQTVQKHPDVLRVKEMAQGGGRFDFDVP